MIATISFVLLVVLALAYVLSPLLARRGDGAHVSSSVEVAPRPCPRCRAPALRTDSFCTRCGAALDRS